MNNDFINTDTAYAIIARCLKLTHVKDHIYKSEDGNILILTKYGFYPHKTVESKLVNILYENAEKKNSKLVKENAQLIELNELYKISSKEQLTESLADLEHLGKRQKHKIKKIIELSDLTNKEKLDAIYKMVTKLIFEEP